MLSNRTRIFAGIFLVSAASASIFMNATTGDAQTAQPKPAPKTATPAKPVKTDGASQVALVESQPVVHARSAAISSCLPAISELSRMTLDAPHTVMSTWNKTDANDHMFSSIAGMKYDNAVAPRAISIIAAAPNAKKTCDGESVQVQPSALSCETIQKNLVSQNGKVQDLGGISLISNEQPMRFALLPTSGNGCTVVSIGSYFAK